MPLNQLSNLKSLLNYKKELKNLKFEVEGFIYNIFFNILQLKKQQRDKNYVCLLCIDFSLQNTLSEYYEMIVKIILDNPLILCVRLLPKAILPVFSSGYSSGIVIDIGYLLTTITPINNGMPYMDKSETIFIGSIELEKVLKRNIIEENILNNKRKIKNVEKFCNNIIPHLDDLVVRCAISVNKKLSVALKDPTEEGKLKNELDYSKVDYCKDVQDFQIGFLKRINLGEVFFGEMQSEEINIAYSLLKMIISLKNEDRKKLCQNIILSGGSSMIIGFYRRLIDEINYWIEDNEFKEIKILQNSIKIHKILFPRNCLTWIGASLISSFDKLNIKQMSILKEDFDNYEKDKSKGSPIEKIISYFN